MSMKSAFVAALAAAVLAVGCSSQKEPAAKAVSAADAALSAVRDEAAKYAPEQLAPVEQAVDKLRAQLAAKDYSDIVTDAPAVLQQVNALKDTATAKKAEAEQALAKAKEQWTALSEELPKLVASLEARVGALGKGRLPKGVDQATADAAVAGLESVTSGWTSALADFNMGKYTDAVAKATEIKGKAVELLGKLGVKST
jgi:hypothetical protein